jgi:hypothetical protein
MSVSLLRWNYPPMGTVAASYPARTMANALVAALPRTLHQFPTGPKGPDGRSSPDSDPTRPAGTGSAYRGTPAMCEQSANVLGGPCLTLAV